MQFPGDRRRTLLDVDFARLSAIAEAYAQLELPGSTILVEADNEMVQGDFIYLTTRVSGEMELVEGIIYDDELVPSVYFDEQGLVREDFLRALRDSEDPILSSVVSLSFGMAPTPAPATTAPTIVDETPASAQDSQARVFSFMALLLLVFGLPLVL